MKFMRDIAPAIISDAQLARATTRIVYRAKARATGATVATTHLTECKVNKKALSAETRGKHRKRYAPDGIVDPPE